MRTVNNVAIAAAAGASLASAAACGASINCKEYASLAGYAPVINYCQQAVACSSGSLTSTVIVRLETSYAVNAASACSTTGADGVVTETSTVTPAAATLVVPETVTTTKTSCVTPSDDMTKIWSQILSHGSTFANAVCACLDVPCAGSHVATVTQTTTANLYPTSEEHYGSKTIYVTASPTTQPTTETICVTSTATVTAYDAACTQGTQYVTKGSQRRGLHARRKYDEMKHDEMKHGDDGEDTNPNSPGGLLAARKFDEMDTDQPEQKQPDLVGGLLGFERRKFDAMKTEQGQEQKQEKPSPGGILSSILGARKHDEMDDPTTDMEERKFDAMRVDATKDEQPEPEKKQSSSLGDLVGFRRRKFDAMRTSEPSQEQPEDHSTLLGGLLGARKHDEMEDPTSLEERKFDAMRTSQDQNSEKSNDPLVSSPFRKRKFDAMKTTGGEQQQEKPQPESGFLGGLFGRRKYDAMRVPTGPAPGE